MFEAFFRPDGDAYAVKCKKAALEQASSSDWPPTKLRGLIVAKSSTDLSKDPAKRSNAVISITLDRENRIGLKDEDDEPIIGADGKPLFVENEDFKFKGVIAAKERFIWVTKKVKKANNDEKDRAYLSVRPFVALNYDNHIIPKKEIDDLSLGALFVWDLDSEAWPEKIYLSPEWITDIEQRESSQFSIEAKSTIPLYKLFGSQRMSGLGYAADRVIRQHPDVKFFWELDGVVDFGDIQDVGDKTELKTIERYTRLGYDLKAQISMRENDLSGTWGLSGLYRFRDDFDHGLARVDLVDVTASYKPPGKSKFSFEVSYDRGENVTNLMPIETWTVGLGFHN